jgi:hypothetical protein
MANECGCPCCGQCCAFNLNVLNELRVIMESPDYIGLITRAQEMRLALLRRDARNASPHTHTREDTR